jgi:enoyl-CoA hydratase
MDDALVRSEPVDGGVVVLTLDDAAHRNALTLELTRALAAAVDGALTAGARAIVLRAEPPVFCAGGSVDDLLEPRADLPEMYAGFLALAEAPVVTVAAVDGPAIGAGVNLPLACDVVVASPAARFDPRFLDLGLHPGGGQLWRLERRVGRQAAAALVLCGDTLDGVEAEAKGLVWRCVPGEELLDTALALARRAASRPAPVMARAKATLDAGPALATAADAVALELEAQRWSMATPDFAARLDDLRARLGR